MFPDKRAPKLEYRAPRILYGVQGEGRGHATRSLEVIRALQEQGFVVKVFSGGDALPVLRAGGIDAIAIPLFRYHYRSHGSLSPWRTLTANTAPALGLFFRAGASYQSVLAQARAFAPDLCISDFEPYVSRIARALGLPLVAIDHQHFLTETLLPRPHRLSKFIALGLYQMGTAILGGKPDRIITSSFWHFPRRPGSRALLVGPFLSSCMPSPRSGNPGGQAADLVVYLKRAGYLSSLLPAFSAHECLTVDVFSDWPDATHENGALPTHSGHRSHSAHPSPSAQWPHLPAHIRLRSIDRGAFLQALADAQALITTAGNQVLGEAIHLGKPTLAFPEPDILEQELNAMALARSGMGEACPLHELDTARLDAFLRALPQYRRRLSQHRQSQAGYDGRDRTMRYLRRMVKARLPAHFLSWAHGPAPSPQP